MRSGLAFANVKEFLQFPRSRRPLRALDVGAGTGAMALRLARLGVHVTLLDSSPVMPDFANRAAWEAGVASKIALREGDAKQAPSLFAGEFFDVILCHNVLEFVDDPGAVLRNASQVMESSSALSVLVRTRAGEVLKTAIQDGDLAGAGRRLDAEWGCESLFGEKVRLFTLESLNAMLGRPRLLQRSFGGGRVISDYLPPKISRDTEHEEIVEAERKPGSRPGFAATARYAQLLVRRIATGPSA